MIRFFVILFLFLGVSINALSDLHCHEEAQKSIPALELDHSSHNHDLPLSQAHCVSHCALTHLVSPLKSSDISLMPLVHTLRQQWSFSNLIEGRFHEKLWRPPSFLI